MKAETEGQSVQIDYGDGKMFKFIAGSPARLLIDDEFGLAVVSGEVRLADGTEAYAVLEIDETSSGEHCGTGILTAGGAIVFQGESSFLELLGKTGEQVFPYRYRYYTANILGSDHHIGDDGWSR